MNQINQNCATEVTEDKKVSSQSIQSSELKEFPDSGKYPPSQGDLVYLGNEGFGFTENVIVSGSNWVINFYATVYDYTDEGNYMRIKQPDSMMTNPAYVERPTEAQKREFRQHLNAMNLDFDYGHKKVINKPITRVEVGSEYYYLDTDMAERTAIDDGVNSGIHYARFLQGNYFKSKDRASLLGQEVRKTLKNLIMPNGSWE